MGALMMMTTMMMMMMIWCGMGQSASDPHLLCVAELPWRWDREKGRVPAGFPSLSPVPTCFPILRPNGASWALMSPPPSKRHPGEAWAKMRKCQELWRIPRGQGWQQGGKG